MKPGMELKHEFVDFIPEELAQGTFYISIRFATASHLCGCGCGNKVVTPIRPTDWRLLFDGKTVSLDPSIGNWSFPCQSHYWIQNNHVKWVTRWSSEQIQRGRIHDLHAKENYFGASVHSPKNSAGELETVKPKWSWWRAIRNWWS